MEIPKELNPHKFGRRTANRLSKKAVAKVSFNNKAVFIEGVPFKPICYLLVKLSDDAIKDLLLAMDKVAADPKEAEKIGNVDKIQASYKKKILTLCKMLKKKGKIIPKEIQQKYFKNEKF